MIITFNVVDSLIQISFQANYFSLLYCIIVIISFYLIDLTCGNSLESSNLKRKKLTNFK